MIHTHIEDTVGFAGLNTMIMNGLDKWLARVGAQVLDHQYSNELPQEERVMGYERLQILARFERHLGHKHRSLELYRKALKGLVNDLGDKSKKTLIAKSNLGNQLREMGMFDEAEKVMSDCLITAEDYLS